MPPAHELTVSRPSVPALALPRVAIRHGVALAVLGLAALSLLGPSSPTYDPWAWIIWGREIAHLDLSTVDGPSWKPLPVLLTTPFALFGSLAPDLWLLVARAGVIAGVVVLFRLGRRLGGLPAGFAAAAPYALAWWTLRNGAMGSSEGLLVALTLAAVERHLDGRPRAAFLLGLGAALLRPEVWPFFGLYGLWLLWREPRLRTLVVAGFAALPALWFLPEWWGSGDPLRAMHRAQNPRSNSPAFAEDPVRAVLDQFHLMITPVIWVGLAALGLAVLWRLVRRRGGPSLAEVAVVAAVLAGAGLWVLEVALMTSDGFSGNVRYLVMPAALVCLAAGAAFAAPAVWHLRTALESIRYPAKISGEVPGLISRAGGATRLRACGDVYTGPFQVPLVAWYMHVHVTQVESTPAIRPAVVFRTKSIPNSNTTPTLRGLGDPTDLRTLSVAPTWRIVAVCKAGA